MSLKKVVFLAFLVFYSLEKAMPFKVQNLKHFQKSLKTPPIKLFSLCHPPLCTDPSTQHSQYLLEILNLCTDPKNHHHHHRRHRHCAAPGDTAGTGRKPEASDRRPEVPGSGAGAMDAAGNYRWRRPETELEGATESD